MVIAAMECEATHIRGKSGITRKALSVVILAFVIASNSVRAQEGAPPDWFVDFSLYPYQHTVENDTDFTTTIRGDLPGRFSYFSYINFTGVVTGGSAALTRTEQNIRYAVGDTLPLDLNVQGVFSRGDNNDFSQLGISWRLHDTSYWADFFDRINLMYRMTFHAIRIGHNDSGSWGMEHAFFLTFPGVSERLYINGWFDQSFGENLPEEMPGKPIIGEVQLGVRVWKDLYAIGEYRVNQKRVGDEYNFAAGIEYKVRW
jgi:hypothetical protein